jgi:hypothetical protein
VIYKRQKEINFSFAFLIYINHVIWFPLINQIHSLLDYYILFTLGDLMFVKTLLLFDVFLL